LTVIEFYCNMTSPNKYLESSSGQGDQSEFPTGGIVRDPLLAADLVI
jgi:hypothetical protein